LQRKLAEALAYVARVRGLAPKAEVRGRAMGAGEVSRYLAQQLDEETPRDVMLANEALLYGLGTVSATFDYRASILALMEAQLLGFYDPKQKMFFVGDKLTGNEADVTLWHELVHALQDQHFDLSRITKWEPDLGDSQAAVHGLAEGDATSAMLDAMLKPRGMTALDMDPSLLRAESVLGAAANTAPPILLRSLVAPYVDGLAFANELRRRNGFKSVDDAWRALPVSTEQLLHIEKYLSGEAPVVVAIPPAPPHAADLRERLHDVLGEQSLRILFEEWLPARTAAEAASDWGGDRIAAFSDESRKRWAIAWHLRFDSVAAAEQAYAAWARSLPLTEPDEKSGAPRVPPPLAGKGTELCRERHTRGPIAIVRRGQDLGVTLGPFRHQGVAVATDPGCPAGLAWAKAIIKP
jgi:hypothetical protein